MPDFETKDSHEEYMCAASAACQLCGLTLDELRRATLQYRMRLLHESQRLLRHVQRLSPSANEFRLLLMAVNGPAMSDPNNALGGDFRTRCERIQALEAEIDMLLLRPLTPPD